MEQSQKYTPRQLAKIFDDANNALLSARAGLTKNYRYLFYSMILHNAKLVVTDQAHGQAINTMGTDSVNIFANPFFVLQILHPEVMGVLAHETIHIADLHNYRIGNRDRLIWNRSTDFSVNLIVLESGLVLPSGALVDRAYVNMSSEQIYNEEYKKSQQTPQPTPSTTDGRGRPIYEPGKLLDPPKATPKEDKREDIKQQVTIAKRVCEVGNIALPDGLAKTAAAAKTPRSRWQEDLREFIARSTTTPAYQTWSRMNRRLISQGIYMPGWHKEDNGHIVIAKDTSGSITSAPNAQFDKEIFRILEDVNPSRVTIIACDNVIRYCETFEGGLPTEIPSKGGGGTSFKPVIDYVNGMIEPPSGLVYFTDLMCYIHGTPIGYPVMWAKWGHGNLSAPYGTTVNINA